MNNTQTTTANHPAVLELADIQATLGLPDADFCRSLNIRYSGSSWGKLKNGTYSGNPEKTLHEFKRALAAYHNGPTIQHIGDTVLFDHLTAAVDAVALARTARDEHKLVVISGSWGAGKTVTARHLHREYNGHLFHARPSWSGSYLRALIGIARGIGLGTQYRSVGAAETAVLDALRAAPALLIIDEANHFSRDSLNFLKTVLNETKSAIVLLTLPGHLARIAATHSEETNQLLRRAISIIHIGPVSSLEVMAIHSTLYPGIYLGHHAPAIASAANRNARMDTVRRIFDDLDPADDEKDALPAAIERVERSIKTILTAS